MVKKFTGMYMYIVCEASFKPLHSNTSTSFDADCIVLHFMQESQNPPRQAMRFLALAQVGNPDKKKRVSC